MFKEGPIRRRLREKGLLKGLIKSSPEEFTLSHIDMTIRGIQEFIEDQKKAAQAYYTESQNPVIQAINGSGVLLAISEEERRHAQQLETLLPKLKEKWEEVYRKLV